MNENLTRRDEEHIEQEENDHLRFLSITIIVITTTLNSYLVRSLRGGNSPKISPSWGRAWQVRAADSCTPPTLYTTCTHIVVSTCKEIIRYLFTKEKSGLGAAVHSKHKHTLYLGGVFKELFGHRKGALVG